MQSQKNPLTETLVEMGYEPGIISFAMEESTNKTLEEVLDLLLFREGSYSKKLKKLQEKGTLPKLNKKYSADIPQAQRKSSLIKKEDEIKNKKKYAFSEDDEDWLDEDIIGDEAPVEVTKLTFGMNPKNIKVGIKKENKKKEPFFVQGVDDRMLIGTPSQKALHYISLVVQDLMSFSSKYPNDYINRLDGYLNNFKSKTNEVNAVILKFIEKQERFPAMLDFKNQVFAVLSKILNMNIKKKNSVNVAKLEKLIQISFELVLLSPKQMNKIMENYSSFCNRLMMPEEKLLIQKLEECFARACSKDPKSYKLQEEEKEENPHNGHNKENIPEEDKMAENDEFKSEEQDEEEEEEEEEEREVNEAENLQERPIIIHHEGLVGKEDCIICMEKTREVVFLPCSHFLTCPLCSPRVIKCPMCNKRIEKHLKIHWS